MEKRVGRKMEMWNLQQADAKRNGMHATIVFFEGTVSF